MVHNNASDVSSTLSTLLLVCCMKPVSVISCMWCVYMLKSTEALYVAVIDEEMILMETLQNWEKQI